MRSIPWLLTFTIRGWGQIFPDYLMMLLLLVLLVLSLLLLLLLLLLFLLLLVVVVVLVLELILGWEKRSPKADTLSWR